MIDKRTLILAAAASTALAASGLHAPAQAQAAYPTKPIRLIVPASPGTAVDVTARFFSERLARRLNSPVVVENRDGAGGAVGITFVSKAPADGYTILFAGIPLYATPHVSEAPVSFDPVKDFTPVARFNGAALAFVVPASSPYKTLQDLIAAMKARPNDLTFASGGNGSTSQMCTALLNEMTRTKARHVAYKGNSPAVTDTVGGQVDFTCNSSAVVPLVKSGKLRALAVTSRVRWDELPEVPTVAEAGVPGYEISSWIGAIAPVGTPAAIVQKLSDELVAIAQGSEFREFCVKQTMYVEIVDAKPFQAGAVAEAARWKRLADLTKAN
ncbi:tripartite tricarboxylate transporter substrate binding protein [Variovorax sp. KK3]|uniref:tripartite tricarboxylate transporter substrate binding protein n=1 Tax=Variovorax sp. KK3 TaxID=1855728 RepID=UPI00097BC96D|nr:tripartite tricarboxylate transporter substrate binding protein [Variovorax sp. KK3]